MSYRNETDAAIHQSRKQQARSSFKALFAAAVWMLILIGCATRPPSTGMAGDSNEPADRPIPEAIEAQPAATDGGAAQTVEEGDQHSSVSGGGESVSPPTFRTFNSTGTQICTNDKGLPLIYLFSSSMCSHCEWGGGVYDFIVKFLAADGRIEAHHYDLLSGDDLLTEEMETTIPTDHLELYHSGSPEDLVPYYNFGCAYDRIGNGYEKENDLVAEGEEMRRVVEALVRMVSKDE